MNDFSEYSVTILRVFKGYLPVPYDLWVSFGGLMLDLWSTFGRPLGDLWATFGRPLGRSRKERGYFGKEKKGKVERGEGKS